MTNKNEPVKISSRFGLSRSDTVISVICGPIVNSVGYEKIRIVGPYQKHGVIIFEENRKELEDCFEITEEELDKLYADYGILDKLPSQRRGSDLEGKGLRVYHLYTKYIGFEPLK